MRNLLATTLAIASCLALAGCTGSAPDTTAAGAWFDEANETVATQWPDRLVAAGGGVVTERDDDGGYITYGLGDAKTVGEFLVACGGGGEAVDVSVGLPDTSHGKITGTVQCTGDYEALGELAEPIDGVSSIELSFATSGSPAGVSLVVLAP